MSTVYEYSTNPLEILEVSELGDGRFFGIELEFSQVPNLRSLPEPARAIWKRDGSIGADGAELVSAPMLLEQIPGWLSNLNCESWTADPSCGMHVHINRRHLSERQIAIIMACIEDDYLYSYVREMAGRDFASSKFCKKSKDNNGSRYQAVNLTRSSTVEVRIFAGTSDKEEVWNRVKWLNDLIEYAAQPGAVPSYACFMVWRGDITPTEHEKIKAGIRAQQERQARAAERQARRQARAEQWFELCCHLDNVGPWIFGGLLIGVFALAAGTTIYHRSIDGGAPPPIEHVE